MSVRNVETNGKMNMIVKLMMNALSAEMETINLFVQKNTLIMILKKSLS